MLAPRDWDKAVSVAYLRLVGETQEQAAAGAGVGERTLRDWEKCSWWKDALEEASARWLNNLTAHARGGLLAAVKADGPLALKVIERTDPRLAPNASKLELSGPDGGAIPTDVTVTLVRPNGST